MKKLSFGVFVLLCLAGCAPLNQIVMSDLEHPGPQFVVDQTKPDDYPAFLTGEGNIYSCHYGIHYESAKEFHPPKAQMFADLFAKALPEITDHRVVLKRFDVYYNRRLAELAGFGNAMGGAIGAAIASAGNVNKNVFIFKKIILVSDPLSIKHDPTEHQVGCDDAHEGEYYASEITGGNNVVITWLTFDVDGKPYRFKSYYQFQPHGKEKAPQGIAEAIRMTIDGVASKIKLDKVVTRNQ